MSEKTPICPRLTAGAWADPGAQGFCLCEGSRCALWAPEMGSRYSGQPPSEHHHGVRDHREPTGLGWCADNLRREPWPDPAKGDGHE